MNKQNPDTGIEYCDYTWNPAGGCDHRCRFEVDERSVHFRGQTERTTRLVACYAERFAAGNGAYPRGFRYFYWRPNKLDEPLKLTQPATILVNSMNDLLSKLVPYDAIRQVFDVIDRAHWHTFLVLTKNAPRLGDYLFHHPMTIPVSNLWFGVSTPPTLFKGRRLTKENRASYMKKALRVMFDLPLMTTRWLSAEPLWFDVAPLLDQWDMAKKGRPVQWIVIGAATDGRRTYQPERIHVQNLLDYADRHKIPVFMKNNLQWKDRRTDMPTKKKNRAETK